MSWLATRSGKRFYPEKPSLLEVDVDDIAHALSNLCRFAGHTPYFYSVAQHSVLVSDILRRNGHGKREQFYGLMHDATEAYLTDLPQPIKRMPEFKFYNDLEARLEFNIAYHFGLVGFNTVPVKRADIIALATEARDLMGNPDDWESIKNVQPDDETIRPMLPAEAKALFLKRFEELGGVL